MIFFIPDEHCGVFKVKIACVFFIDLIIAIVVDQIKLLVSNISVYHMRPGLRILTLYRIPDRILLNLNMQPIELSIQSMRELRSALHGVVA